jgi:hypothetical protein
MDDPAKGHTEMLAWFSKPDHQEAGKTVAPHDLFTIKHDIIGDALCRSHVACPAGHPWM